MVETVKRFRETGAVVVLGASIAYVVMSLVRLGWLVLHDHASLPEAAHVIGGSSLSVVMVLALLAVVLTCVVVRPTTRRGPQLVRLAAWVVSIAAGLEALFLLLGLFSHAVGPFGALLEVVGGLLEIGVKAAAATALWRAVRSAHEPVADEPRRPVDPASEPAAVPPAQQASWSADQAAGAVWTRAGDAASGAAASTWGVPGQASHGWDAASTAPALEAPVPRGPWATAGELAGAPEQSADTEAVQAAEAGGEPPVAGAVQWTPSPRGQ